MSSEPPPNPITKTFNLSAWIHDAVSSGLTQAQADELYLSKVVDGLCGAIVTFTNGVEIWGIYGSRNTRTATNLTDWTAFNPAYENFVSVGSFYELNGFSITPVISGIQYYPQANRPIQLSSSGLYTITATVVLSASAISGAGRFAFGVTTQNAAANWLPSTNGGLIGNLTRTYLPTSIDTPIIMTVSFNIYQTTLTNMYFIYELQGTMTATLTVNFSITRLA